METPSGYPTHLSRPSQMEIRSILNPSIDQTNPAAPGNCSIPSACIESRFYAPQSSAGLRPTYPKEWPRLSPNYNYAIRRETWLSTAQAVARSDAPHYRGSRRPVRTQYDEEEMHFVWYHLIDLSEPWNHVRDNFNSQFSKRGHREIEELQYEFYQFLRQNNYPGMRQQRNMLDEIPREKPFPRYRVVQWTGIWYPWMRPFQDQMREQRASL